MKIMAFSLDWFKSVPGILISLGVVFLIAALIMFIVSSIKEKKENKKNNVEVLGQNQMPPKKETVQAEQPVVQTTPVQSAPQPEVVPVQPVQSAPEAVQTPVVAETPAVAPIPVVQTPVVETPASAPVAAPVVETPVVPQVAPTPEVVQTLAPEIQSIDSISGQSNMDDTIIGLEQPEAVNLEKTIIYNGNDPSIAVQQTVAQAPVAPAPEVVSQPIPMDAPATPANSDNTIKPMSEMEQL